MVMIAMVIAMAATIFLKPGPKRQLRDIQEIVDAVSPTVGGTLAKVLVAVGATGASMVAALVVSITPAWSICELRGVERSHEKSYAEARGFYQGFFAILLLSGAVAIIPGFGDSAALSIQVEVLNALRMPFVVAFLFVLASKRGVLPERYRLRGWYQYLLGSVFLVCSVLCVYASILDFIEQFRGGHELRFRHTMLRRPLRDSGSVAGVEIAPVGETSESTWTGETGAHSKKGGLLANIFY
ncbi:unnamed protein product [Amoebophrya sp. A25]|nr:unnamed protein product [Amoebophrya sp. A25]|eukprot:GSA25T00012646001.1